MTTSASETAGNLKRSFPRRQESFAGYTRVFWQRSPTFNEDDGNYSVAISLIGGAKLPLMANAQNNQSAQPPA